MNSLAPKARLRMFCRKRRIAVLLLFCALFSYAIYVSQQCDFEDGKSFVATPSGRKIRKFYFNSQQNATKNFVSLTKRKGCDFGRNGKIFCPDIRRQGETMLRQMQLAIVRMLFVFHKICLKHGIKYWMWRGALLGTVRHGGFIPWDNDLDIGMMREDYEKFRLFSSEMPADIFLQNASSDPEYGKAKTTMIGKLRDNNGCLGYCAKVGCKFHDGPMIDIFGFDDLHSEIVQETTNNRVAFTVFKKHIFPLKQKLFEGFHVFIPNQYKAILAKNYGSNYEELPSDNKRCPPGCLIGLPWISCTTLIEMNKYDKARHIYLSSVSKLKWLAWYL